MSFCVDGVSCVCMFRPVMLGLIKEIRSMRSLIILRKPQLSRDTLPKFTAHSRPDRRVSFLTSMGLSSHGLAGVDASQSL